MPEDDFRRIIVTMLFMRPNCRNGSDSKAFVIFLHRFSGCHSENNEIQESSQAQLPNAGGKTRSVLYSMKKKISSSRLDASGTQLAAYS